MKELELKDVGVLPQATGRWVLREGGGYLWMINEDEAVQPMVLVDGVLRQVVPASENPDVPLIQPKAAS